ncbi:MAG: Crp/Fnr family transcriptional regulator [Deltaproteobacteria bacterium]|nr:Crp/Fnr family transcriptional regulator [Deltaproteobacteria bacterium]
MEKVKNRENLTCENCEFRSKSLFGTLCREDLAQVQPHKQLRQYRRRELLFGQGDDPAGLFCVASGQVKIFQVGIDGRDQIVRLAGPGDPIGYRALFADERYNASAEALEDCEVCFIDKASVLSLLENKPLFMRRLLQWLCQDLRQAEERLRQFAQKPVRERLAETLVLLGQAFGRKVPEGLKLEIRLTRQEIAELAGTVLETAVRAMSEFRREGLLGGEGRALILPDPAALARVARMDDFEILPK